MISSSSQFCNTNNLWCSESLVAVSVLIRVLTKKRQYGEIVMPLQAVMEVMKHFHNYMDIPQIKQLASQVYYT